MQIVIPMSGVGKRFIDAGYKKVKPLIEVDGKPIIEHVVNMFPGESKFIFVCNKEHLQTTDMEKILKSIAPEGKVIGIDPHKKGPVYAVAQAFDVISDQDETIVNYCDFGKFWDYGDFLKHTRERGADGAIAAYRGFHPHMLGSTNYAFMRDQEQWMQEIREKEPFTDNRMQEFASDGTYYFKSGACVKKYFAALIEKNVNLKGEYYISLVYNLMREDNLKVSIYEIQHMLQWGEPKDLQEYQRWSDYFTRVAKGTSPSHGRSIKKGGTINLIPLAGRGKRFSDQGYTTPKPLLDVSGKPMIIQASAYLPSAGRRVFVCLKEHLDQYPLKENLCRYYPEAKIVALDQVTEGQACTCALGLEEEGLDAPLLIAASDNGMLFDCTKYQDLIDDDSVDCIAFSFRHHPSSANNPQMYGWIKVDDQNTIESVSVKVPISDDPFNDHAIIGAFYFRKAKHFCEALKRLQAKNERVNNEFYVDSCLNEIVAMGLTAKVFEVDHYICWGTPDDLRTYEYWQSFFHKCAWHPYSLEKDSFMNQDQLGVYKDRANHFEQQHR